MAKMAGDDILNTSDKEYLHNYIFLNVYHCTFIIHSTTFHKDFFNEWGRGTDRVGRRKRKKGNDVLLIKIRNI